MPGLEWREQDGTRYLRIDYRVASGVEQTLALYAAAVQQIVGEEPGQRLMVIIDDPSSAEVVALSRKALSDYHAVFGPLRTRFAAVGLPRSAATVVRSFNALGGRGRIAGCADEAEALDWLLTH